MSKTWQVILAGDGGQGLIVGGRVMAQAAILEGKNVVQTQSYGISARGGYSEAQVIIADDEIYSPSCEQPDLVLALTQAAYDRYCDKVSEGCLIIYEQGAVESKRGNNEIGYPFRDTCLELGDLRVINILFLGVVLKNIQLVSEDSMVQAVKSMLPPKLHELNLNAFNRGFGRYR